MSARIKGRKIAGRRCSPRHGSRAASIGALSVALLLALAACGPGQTSVGAGDAAVTPVGGASTSTRPPVSVPPLKPAAATSPIASVDPTSPGTPAASTDPPSDPPADPPAATTMPVAAPPALITTSLTSFKSVNPAPPITVHVADGTLTSVGLVNPREGVTVPGKLSADGRSWTSTEALGYGKDYQLSATAVNADGMPSTTNSEFSTLTPSNMTMPYFRTIGGYPLASGGTFGVGMVAIVHFDEPIADEAAAQKALHVTTTPHVDGSWFWADDQNVHWRPESFYAPGTKVTIDADVYGVQVGPGLYGQSDRSVSFTIGRAQITYAYDSSPKVDKVIVKNGAGAVLRTMNTSMGEHRGVTVNGRYINFYTMGGTYTVIAHENPAMMSSASYGLPADAPGGYAPEPIYWSTRISTDGIYLHQLDNTIWAQNSGRDVSHGCLNLSHANAQWFYQNSLIGDPVVIAGAKGAPTINLSQGGDWSVPWSKWLAGSALH